jgi:hypothetical protein
MYLHVYIHKCIYIPQQNLMHFFYVPLGLSDCTLSYRCQSICIHLCVYIYTHKNTCISIDIYIYMYVYLYKCIYNTQIYTCIYAYVCMYNLCIKIHMHMNIYEHTFLRRPLLPLPAQTWTLSPVSSKHYVNMMMMFT